MSKPRILIIEDEKLIRWSLQQRLTEEGYQVSEAEKGELGLALLANETFDLIMLDYKLPDMTGLNVLEKVRESDQDIVVVMMTAFSNVETAVQAMRLGAYDYVSKPFNMDALMLTVEKALQTTRLRREVRDFRTQMQSKFGFDRILGNCPAMVQLFGLIRDVAASGASTVFLRGESGTGKDLVAKAIHYNSERAVQPFMNITCTAITETLLESELFGHEKGAFTDARQMKKGLLELADGGTVFLDELADIPMPVQVKLLRVLEHNEVTPVGSNQPNPLSIRILAATHQDLERKIAEGTFRHDLFFRLNVFQIHLPALRERRDDILALAEHFLKRLDARVLPLLPVTVQFLTNQTWLGNVRELRNALEHAVIVARGGPLLPEHFPASSALIANPKDQLAAAVLHWLHERVGAKATPENLYDELLRAIEPPLLEELMRRLQGNRVVAAQWLGLNRATVRKKLTEYGLADIHRPAHKPAEDDDEDA
jgi:DNA-binding NtrC family response regulator